MRTPERPSTPDTTQTTAAQRWYDRGTTEPSCRICRTAKSPASAEAVRDTRCTSVPRSTFGMIVEVSSRFEQVFFRSTSRGGRPGSSRGHTSAPTTQYTCLSTQCRAQPRRYNVLELRSRRRTCWNGFTTVGGSFGSSPGTVSGRCRRRCRGNVAVSTRLFQLSPKVVSLRDSKEFV